MANPPRPLTGLLADHGRPRLDLQVLAPTAYRRPLDPIALSVGGLAIVLGAGIGYMAVRYAASQLLLVLAVLGLVAAITAFIQPEWGLLALVFITYTRFSDVLVKFHGSPSVAQPLLALLVAIVLVRRLWQSHRSSGWVRAALLLGAYGLVGFASLLYAADFARSRAALSDFAKDAVVALMVVVLLQDAPALRRVVWVLLIAGLFMGSLSVYQQLTGSFGNNYGGFAQANLQNIVGATSDYRVAGPIGDPNFYAQILVALVPLAFDRLWNEPRPWQRLLAGASLAVCVLSVFFTFSRGGFVALAVVLAWLAWRRRPSLLGWIIIALIGFLALRVMPANYLERLQTVPEAIALAGGDPRNEISFRGRVSENTAAWLMFREHPLLGVGLDNYPAHYLRYSRLIGTDPRREDRTPHSLYLQIASETGLTGLAVFGVLLLLMFRGLRQAQRAFLARGQADLAGMVAALQISLVGYLTAAVFLHAAYPRFWWLWVGIALAVPEIARAARRAPPG